MPRRSLHQSRTKLFAGALQHEVWNKLLHEDPPDSSVLNPDAAPNIHATIRCALSKNPGDRFQSAAAMVASLPAERTAPTDALRELARDADRTVLHTGAAPPSLVGLDPVLLTTIERRLAHHVGPIAGYVVRSAAKKVDTIDKLYDVLMTNVPQGVKRDRFREEWQLELSASPVQSGIGSTRQHAAAASLPEAELARHLGPWRASWLNVRHRVARTSSNSGSVSPSMSRPPIGPPSWPLKQRVTGLANPE